MLAVRLFLTPGWRRGFAVVTSASLRSVVSSAAARPAVTFASRRLLWSACGSATMALVYARHLRCARCEALVQPTPFHDPWLLVQTPQSEKKIESVLVRLVKAPLRLIFAVFMSLRLLLRTLSLTLRFLPLALSYPVAMCFERTERWWWSAFLVIIQSSGPTVIKLGQWASTRRDIFSKAFCDKLSVLHTKTKKQRYFRDCESQLDALFGAGFMKKHGKKVFVSIEPYSIGSGCIAQVYKATIDREEFERATGSRVKEFEQKKHIDIAIKVAEPGVVSQIELDLAVVRAFTWLSTVVMPSLHFVDPLGAVEQFEMVLRRQVDLSNEARAMMKFAQNFDPVATGIRFPVVLAFSPQIIVETFEPGVYINKLVDGREHEELAVRQSQAVRRRIALLGARCLLKMIFVDNFVHGDLHPGNILIRFNDRLADLPGLHKAPTEATPLKKAIAFIRNALNLRESPTLRFTDDPEMEDEPTLVVLDTGIAVTETPQNLRNLRAVFRAVVEKKGYEVGELLLAHSPNQHCKNPEEFCKQVAVLVKKAREENSLRKLNISALLSQLFSVVSEHRVQLDSSFTSVVLSVMVLEGFGRSLDPDLDLFLCARPYLLNVIHK